MPAEVIEPPTKTSEEYIPPQAPPPKQPLKVKAGDVWKAEFEKLTKAEAAAIESPPEPQAPTKPEPEVKIPDKEPDAQRKETPTLPKEEAEPTKEVKTPTSPLDVVTADQKPEVKAEEPDILEGFDEKNPDWKRAREVMRKQKEEKKALEATIAELKQTPKSDPEEIARLAKERDELKQSLAEREEIIKTVDVRLSEDYQKIAKKQQDSVQKIASRAKSYGIDPDALISAVSLPEGKFRTDQIKAVMADVDSDDRATIKVLIEKLDGYNEELMEFEKEAPKKYEEIQAKREAQLREQQENSVKAIRAEFGRLTEVLPKDVVTLREVSEDVPGGTEWNQAIKAAKENALRILSPGGSDFNESAAVAYKGAHYDSLMNMFLKDHQELLDARKRLEEFDTGGPDFKGTEKPKIEPKLKPSEKFHKALDQIKGSSSQDD